MPQKNYESDSRVANQIPAVPIINQSESDFKRGIHREVVGTMSVNGCLRGKRKFAIRGNKIFGVAHFALLTDGLGGQQKPLFSGLETIWLS